MDAIELSELPELRGIRIDSEFKQELKKLARYNERTLAAEIRAALKAHLANSREEYRRVHDYREIDRG